jgi:Tfp pilus assembly protein PilO
MSTALVLDGLVAVLLVVTVGYCVLLHRRLGTLRGAQAELERLLAGFTSATEQARHGVAELRAAGDQVGRELQTRLDAARAVRDELNVITQAGNDLADRLDRRLMERKEAVTGQPSVTTSRPLSESERELMAALRQAR